MADVVQKRYLTNRGWAIVRTERDGRVSFEFITRVNDHRPGEVPVEVKDLEALRDIITRALKGE